MIRQLDASIYNKISAGEVVERPASVVKELVENAIDAGATVISIDIRGGGLEYISVADNGSGISAADLPLVFAPHATSKIQSAEDLFCIASLGFRGEAMASIAAVGEVTIATRCAEEDAMQVCVDGGVLSPIIPASRAVGTTVEVRKLFVHTPARLKFLKSAKGESREITTLVERVLMSNPTIAFRYVLDGKIIYQTHGAGLEDTLTAIFDDDCMSHLLPIEAEEYGYKLSGFCSDTLYSKGNKSGQITIVNGRVINNLALSSSCNNVYKDYLMRRTFGVFVLNITIPPEEVDVNVHPTKADVRFAYGSKLLGFVYRTMLAVVKESINMLGLQYSDVHVSGVASTTSEDASPASLREIPGMMEREGLPSHAGADDIDPLFGGAWNPVSDADTTPRNGHDGPVTIDSSFGSFVPRASTSHKANMTVCENDDYAKSYLASLARDAESATVSSRGLSSGASVHLGESTPPALQALSAKLGQQDMGIQHDLRIVGQVLGTYLVAELDGALLLVDQHAAAERVAYDKLMAEYSGAGIMVQPLLVPFDFTLSEEEANTLLVRTDTLAEIGIDIAVLNAEEQTFSLSSVPSILEGVPFDELIRSVLAEEFTDSKELFRERLAYAACRGSIKGNTTLSQESIQMLVKSLFAHGIPSQCPHGRPTYIRFSSYEIEKLFKRKV